MARLSLVAAVARNGVIGRSGTMPWDIPEDLALFRDLTLGKPVIMGRKTHVSIGRPLPGRTNIVVTRDPDFSGAGLCIARSPEAALVQARDVAKRDGVAEIMVAGGAEIYAAFLPLADRLYLSEVALAVEGDTRFPEFPPGPEWHEGSRIVQAGTPGFDFVTYDRA